MASQPKSEADPGSTLAKARTILPTKPKLCQECRPTAPILDRVVSPTRKSSYGCPAREYTIYKSHPVDKKQMNKKRTTLFRDNPFYEEKT